MGYMACMYTNDYNDQSEMSDVLFEEVDIINCPLTEEELDKFVD